MIEALRHYWTNIAPSFPFIHRGTFDLETAPTSLLMMMIITGSTHMKPRRDFSTTVSAIRGLLVQHCGLDMPISTLQAFCLCHVHDTWYGTRESQFVAQCMWPVIVAHSRKKGIGVAGRPEHDVQEEEAWAAWAKDEGEHLTMTWLIFRTPSSGFLCASHRHSAINILESTLFSTIIHLCSQS